MAMACMGDHKKHFDYFKDRIHLPNATAERISDELVEDEHGNVGHLHNRLWKDDDLENFKQMIEEQGEKAQFEISAAIQRATENKIREQIDPYIEKYKPKNLCLAGGVSLNSVLIGKMYEWYDGIVENIYIPPVPYDAGLSIGCAQILYHDEKFMNQPRVKWEDSSPTYLGFNYHEDSVYEELEKRKDKVSFKKVDESVVIDLLTKDDNVISVFNQGSESGRRALGNRSILADPRSPNMKDIINEKVKHRQWFRPFAPSILREDVSDWFEIDVDSPYMTTVIKFKEEVRDKVPAVVHFDGSARLQTVTENDNKWYYNFIKKFKEKTGVPIVLNTSFNDREPIVETPEHAVNCFLGTDIDYLYFCELQILVKKI
jgi:carbamoyltransferase